MIFCALQKKWPKENAVEWFNNNHMIANPDKLPVIFLSKTDNSVSQKSNICNNNTETTNLVKLLGIETDHPLKFNQRISTLCFMAAVELNALSNLQWFIGKAKKCNNK